MQMKCDKNLWGYCLNPDLAVEVMIEVKKGEFEKVEMPVSSIEPGIFIQTVLCGLDYMRCEFFKVHTEFTTEQEKHFGLKPDKAKC